MTTTAIRKETPEVLWELIPRLLSVVRAAMVEGQPEDDRLTLSQVRALRPLVEGCRYPGALAKRLDITPASASELVDALVRRGLVERSEEPGDRRCIRLIVTSAGYARFELAHSNALKALSRIISELDPEAASDLNGPLNSLLELLDQQVTEGGKNGTS